MQSSGVSTGGQRRRSPDFRLRGTVMQKSSHFLTHNNAIAGFTIQSIGLPAYACKTDSSTAVKLAPKMHQNLPFWAQKSKKFTPSLPPTPWHLVPRTRHDSSPTLKPWICPWCTEITVSAWGAHSATTTFYSATCIVLYTHCCSRLNYHKAACDAPRHI